MLGITAGTHRLWAHRSYKAKWPLRAFLMLMHTLAFQVDKHLDILAAVIELALPVRYEMNLYMLCRRK
jgi:hypothetical protein